MGAVALAFFLISEVADAPVITGTLKPAGLKLHIWGGENVKQLYVGIDVSSTKHAVYLMKPNGDKFSSFPMQNNLGGAKMVSERIVSALKALELHDVVIGTEATSIYGDNLVYALREDNRLGQFNRKIHVPNPKQVKKFKDAYSDLPKNDSVDAFVIADHLRFRCISKGGITWTIIVIKPCKLLPEPDSTLFKTSRGRKNGLQITCF